MKIEEAQKQGKKFLYKFFDFHLPGFLGAKLDEWSTTHEESEHIRHHVVDHHHQDRHDKPD